MQLGNTGSLQIEGTRGMHDNSKLSMQMLRMPGSVMKGPPGVTHILQGLGMEHSRGYSLGRGALPVSGDGGVGNHDGLQVEAPIRHKDNCIRALRHHRRRAAQDLPCGLHTGNTERPNLARMHYTVACLASGLLGSCCAHLSMRGDDSGSALCS